MSFPSHCVGILSRIVVDGNYNMKCDGNNNKNKWNRELSLEIREKITSLAGVIYYKTSIQ